ncbi:MAG: amidase family protein [Myxococcales bacterium]|nr:amidase family protein [Myxococcales bacterium]
MAAERRPDIRPFTRAIDQLSPARRKAIAELVEEAGVEELGPRLRSGSLTAHELLLHTVAHIGRVDATLRSVSELDPDALAVAAELDASPPSIERPLHGIPVLVKDNIATGGVLHTTAGAAALRELKTGRDAFLVRRLRDAGAIVVGKSTMTEWANRMSTGQPHGYSAVGGQARNPHGRFNVSGSSSGSAVAVAAGLVPIAIGTETWGSLVAPASQLGVVTIKPSLGLVSREGIIETSRSMDTAGPLAPTVLEAALLLDAIAAPDPNDPETLRISRSPRSFTNATRPDALAGKRIGMARLRSDVAAHDGTILERVRNRLETAGAMALDLPPFSIIDARRTSDEFDAIVGHDLRRGLSEFLAPLQSPIKSLADVIAFNHQQPQRHMPFGQDRLVKAEEQRLDEAQYQHVRDQHRERARRRIDDLLDDHDLDAIVALGSPFYLHYCAAGYPAVNVPAGTRPSGEPVGVTFIGKLLSDHDLIGYAFAFEQTP